MCMAAEYAEIPFDALAYTAGECNYGGKVTDGHDRHTLMTILADIYAPRAVEEEVYTLSESGTYCIGEPTDHAGYLQAIAKLPMVTEPEAFGLHPNATINRDLQVWL